MTTTSQPHALAERALRAVDDLRDEIVALTVELVRIPTVNPPGENYRDGALAIGRHLARCGFGVEYIAADGLKEHTRQHPRVNVVGARAGTGARAARPHQRPFRRGPGRRGLDGRPVGRHHQGRQDLRPRHRRHEGRHRRRPVRRRGPAPRRHRAAGERRAQRHRGRGERRLRRRRLPVRDRPHPQGPHRLRHHPGAAQRRPHLPRPPRRLLVRGDDAAAASRTARCRFSAAAPSSRWPRFSRWCATS